MCSLDEIIEMPYRLRQMVRIVQPRPSLLPTCAQTHLAHCGPTVAQNRTTRSELFSSDFKYKINQSRALNII
jgi:hypothetical protein